MTDMNGVTGKPKDFGPHGSLLGPSERRLKRRRAAETRLKGYGIAAIVVSGLALFTLMYSVITQAKTAMSESYVTMSVTLDRETLGLGQSPSAQEIRRAGFAGLRKDVLKETFPTITGRSERRALYDVVSGGAVFELADYVAANPQLLGQQINYAFLASDVTDLYLKGEYGRLQDVDVRGDLSLEIDGDVATITSSEADFLGVLTQVRRGLVEDATVLRRKAARQMNAVRVYGEKADVANTDKARKKLLAKQAKAEKKRDKLLAQAEALETRAAGVEGNEELDEDNRSLFVRFAGGWIQLTALSKDGATGKVIMPPGVDDADNWRLMVSEQPPAARKVDDTQIVAIEMLRDWGQVDQVFNTRFFTAADSREPELAGIWGAAAGSFWTMLVTFLLAFPIGVSAAIYLEEFAPRNKITDLIEVNINNLAAVPSIVFGLLGLAVILGFFGVPRSAPLAGGIVMALMTLPTVIIASRVAIAAVPPSIRDAALGVGASQMQSTFHHVVPLAMPGILTGAILGMARALGETAPLIMIGMVAFIVDIPKGITDSATVLPVQIYRWSDFPERAFEAKTGAAIVVLLLFLVVMNAAAVILRRRFERRW